MKLRLNPAELGQIDVQLDMHQGGLDARFQTDNPLTKDLILQGSGRLKDSLNQHGMTVASVWVNSDDRRQSGGNSTPQQQQRRAPSGQTTSRTESVVEASAPRQSRADGWDMLA
jgi:flagellar hook-length control protein FliK